MEPENPKSPELRFGKYSLIATLGQGGMADVFLAVTQGPAGFSKLHVIKRLRRADIGDENDIITMFLDEARLAARLNHPNVVQTNEVGDVDGEYFIAMEYLDGQPLNRIIQRMRVNGRVAGPRGEAILLKIIADTLAGLHYAHELSDYDGTPLHVVHRDCSPHNIFVTYEGHTKVVDFGIAKAATRSSQTTTGVLKGKLSYMAPEQCRAKPVDRRADIFVIGIVLWEILAGVKMWKGLADMEIVNKIFNQEIPRLTDYRPDLDPDLVRIMDRALAYDPAERYNTAAELRADLLSYLDRTGQRITPDETGELVASLFSDRRSRLQTVIDSQLKRLRSGSASLLDMNSMLPPPSTRSSSSSGSQPLPNLAYPTSDGSGVTQQVPQAPPPPPPPARRMLFPILAGAAAAGVVALLLLRGRGPDPIPPPPAAADVAASQPGGPTPSSASAEAPTPKTIELRITAAPATAKLFLDDVGLGANPFTGRFPADGARHLVRVEAQGYATQKEFAQFGDDVSMEFDLEKKTSATVSYRPRRTTGGEEGMPYEPSPTSTNTEDPAKAAAAGKPKRTLSGSDPWSGAAGTSTTPAPAPVDTATNKPKRTLSSDPWAK
ncbi:serine/threonine protein kinase [Chondromyces apiculatus]|uniref:Serine/threonine protein kinase n=1 Tax=Chondromyces apiculatus DSM 436 TaxID=1192034 RepID=A0A017TAX1_9BACT|nr:serine/threonine-protein kinase [Chondromyces apiculatus]EYF05766.1 serine/threonine protein kinase [Chondromyces apiculatus DSM 436]